MKIRFPLLPSSSLLPLGLPLPCFPLPSRLPLRLRPFPFFPSRLHFRPFPLLPHFLRLHRPLRPLLRRLRLLRVRHEDVLLVPQRPPLLPSPRPLVLQAQD